MIRSVRGSLIKEFTGIVDLIAQESNSLLNNFRSAGITNVFYGLDAKKIFDLVARSRGKEFIILRMFFSDDEFNFLADHLKEYIENNHCKFRIILLSPHQHAVRLEDSG